MRFQKKGLLKTMQKIIDFGVYCQKCKYFDRAENEDPCWDCLTLPVNEDSHKPTEFVEKEEK